MFIKILLELVQEFCKFCNCGGWTKTFFSADVSTVEQFSFGYAVPALDHFVKFCAAFDA
jgi:hypothetical protein